MMLAAPIADLAVRFLNTELAIDVRHAETLAQLINGVLLPALARLQAPAQDGEAPALPELAGKLSGRVGRTYDDKGRPMFDRHGSLAIIGAEGSLVHKGFAAGYFGRTSYEYLNAAGERAARDHTVRGIVYEVDSFGGEVAGAFEAADTIRKISAEKPTMAILTDHALSAGYLLASAARQVAIPPTGQAGSIGVVTLHVDISKMLSDFGVKVTPLHAGALKVQGNMFEALGEDARTAILAKLEKSRDLFAETVGRHRGKRFTKKKALDTEAGYFSGQEAVDLGLADVVAHPSDALSAFARAIGATGALAV